ncbi:MAG: helix-turn-helix domain-containing protein, partial [Planctomycetes bacterium]|nr:helix-turn-helix domain-containing protein [Planctomycetota bacterium]
MIQVLERFHRIMEYVAKEPETPRTMTELAKLLGISTPACSNIIKTMVHLGYLDSAGPRKGYLLGAMAHILTRRAPHGRYLVEAGTAVVERLVREVNEMVVLVTESGGKRIELITRESDAMVQVRSPNQWIPSSLFCTATGVLMLSYKTAEEFAEYWRLYGEIGTGLFRTDDYETTCRKRDKIRKQGYFVSEPERKEGDDSVNESCTMAFPVFDKERLVAALGSRVPM